MKNTTAFRIERLHFDTHSVRNWGSGNIQHRNWPVVYLLNNDSHIYVGETLSAETRLRQHLDAPAKKQLEFVRVILDDRFNKSACLDLESFLIKMFAGDGKFQVLNSNAGITEADYYDRKSYQSVFRDVFEELRHYESFFTRSIPEIINRDLFKLSPFKALNHDQAIAIEDILDGLFVDLADGASSQMVVRGQPGTGKTIIGIYLLKLLQDIRLTDPEEGVESESMFSDFFTPGHAELLQSVRLGLVVPQQSLRESIKKVFKKTPGMSEKWVLTPFEVGESEEDFDLLVVDEAHRLNRRANQPSAVLNSKFRDNNLRLFGMDDPSYTQLDWIRRKSKHSILLLDAGQSVRPADIPTTDWVKVEADAKSRGRLYNLQTQMRVQAGQDYIGYVRAVLSDEPPLDVKVFGGYDLRFYDDFDQMYGAIRAKDEESGLSRLVAGYAWEWKSRRSSDEFDIALGSYHLKWNSTDKDWINSRLSLNEVGSIHTVQGYDLNYAGVIVGPDLKYDDRSETIVFDRSSYFDKKGVENNKKLGISYSDEDIRQYVLNIYSVLLTRGILGTFVYVCDPNLREYLRAYLSLP